jgi:hypothetical protein
MVYLVPMRRVGPAGLESIAVASVSFVMYFAKCRPYGSWFKVSQPKENAATRCTHLNLFVNNIDGILIHVELDLAHTSKLG